MDIPSPLLLSGHAHSSPSRSSSSQPAVLSALKALQDKVRRLESDRSLATSKAAALRSSILTRESAGTTAREDFARAELAAMEQTQATLSTVVRERHELELKVTRKEERRKAVSEAVERESESQAEYRTDKAHLDGRMAMLSQRTRAMQKEVLTGQGNVESLTAVLTNETNETLQRIAKLTKHRDELRAKLDAQRLNVQETETTIGKSSSFLANLMSINEALVAAAHAKRAAGLTHRSSTPSSLSPTHSQRMRATAREEEGITKLSAKTKKKRKVKKKQPLRKPTSFDEVDYYDPPPPRRTPPPPPPRHTIRTTKSSRLAAASSAHRLAVHTNSTLPLKSRIRLANHGPVPFLPAPRLHSFNVLAAVSEAVRTEVGDVEYVARTRTGSLHRTASPPRKRSPPRATSAHVVQSGGALAVTLPGVALCQRDVSPLRERVLPSPPQTAKPSATATTGAKLPAELLELLASLEGEFDELNENYISLLSSASTAGGDIKMTSESDEKRLQELATSMARKEEQMKMFKYAIPERRRKGIESETQTGARGAMNPVRELDNLSPPRQTVR